jgi:hypothetical protein
MSLQANGQMHLPVSAKYRAKQNEVELTYPNGSVAVIRAEAKQAYFRFCLISLAPREGVDHIIWGPLQTTLSQTIGDIIGVVRDDTWAIGMLGLDDNTISGMPMDGDCYQMGYIVHSPDPVTYPIPATYKEGQRFSVGGDGISDVAFYSHPEEYFQQIVGSGAVLEPAFGSTISYHATDRRKSYTHFYSLLPGFENSKPRHQISDPVNVDYIGSTVALYACPDDKGLSVLESIVLAEGLPHPTIDGKWIRDPASFRTDMAWYGNHDKLIEYADVLGITSVQDEALGEYYTNPADRWAGKRVGFSGGRSVTIREFTEETNKHGIRYGLHTLCMFTQPHSSDVTPVPNEHLQTVLRTKIAQDITPTDTVITVTDPSYLAEKGTWHGGPDGNVLRIGKELLTYDGISSTAPYTLLHIKRGQYGTTALAHAAKDELVKLQMNCYHGFIPDMELSLEYADYYAHLFHEGGMEYVDFDGLESNIYQNHGYFAVRRFYRRLFETYEKLSGGKYLRVMGSCVFPGSWEYMSVCNVGGGNNMFDPVLNRWGIEGKDIRYGFQSSYFPCTFGIQDYQRDWSVYDIENLQAKAIGWNATYMLGLSEEAVEGSGEKAALFKAFRLWEDARLANVFSKSVKARLKDTDYKFHLEKTGKDRYVLYPVRELRISGQADDSSGEVTVANPYQTQSLRFALKTLGAANGVTITLPDGSRIHSARAIESGQFVICNGSQVYLADKFRNRIADLVTERVPVLQQGNSVIGIRFDGGEGAKPHFDLVVWEYDKGENVGK